MEKLTILIGESENIFIDLLTEMTNEVIGSNREVRVLSAYHADELLNLARINDIDLFFLTLNNLFIQGNNFPAFNRIERILHLVFDLKHTYCKPIITFAGWPDDQEFPSRAIASGADHFNRIPCKLDVIKAAIRDCLAENSW